MIQGTDEKLELLFPLLGGMFSSPSSFPSALFPCSSPSFFGADFWCRFGFFNYLSLSFLASAGKKINFL
jgi:hypothetical protein